MSVVLKPIRDNELLIENKEYFGLDVEKVIVGVENSERQEIVTNPETGLNYSRNAIEGQEIYNLKQQKHHPWFILDLETGSKGWYPGCVIHGDIVGSNIEIKEEPNDESLTIKVVSGVSITVLDIDAIDQEPFDEGWYKIKYDVEGYVKKEYVENLRYENPF